MGFPQYLQKLVLVGTLITLDFFMVVLLKNLFLVCLGLLFLAFLCMNLLLSFYLLFLDLLALDFLNDILCIL